MLLHKDMGNSHCIADSREGAVLSPLWRDCMTGCAEEEEEERIMISVGKGEGEWAGRSVEAGKVGGQGAGRGDVCGYCRRQHRCRWNNCAVQLSILEQQGRTTM